MSEDRLPAGPGEPTDLLIIGNIVCDIITSIRPGSHPWGTLSHIEKPIAPSVGGNGAISALAAAKLGLRVKLAGKIGNDMFTDFVVRMLDEGGVDHSLVKRTNGPGSVTMVLSDPTKDRTFFHHTGPNSELGDMETQLCGFDWDNCRTLLLTSYFLLPGFQGEVAKRIASRARNHNIRIFLDVAWDESGRWDFEGMLGSVDYLLLNDDEGGGITGRTMVPEMAEDLLDRGPGAVVIKLGKKGVFVAGSGTREHVPSCSVETKETTGCGDIFNTAFIHGILNGKNLVDSARFASCAGAYAAQFSGTVNSLPTLPEIQALGERIHE